MKNLMLSLLALPLSTFAGTAVVTPGTWDLYRSSTIVQAGLPTLDACVKAADQLNVTRTYTCRTRTKVSITAIIAPPPPPPPPAVGTATLTWTTADTYTDGSAITEAVTYNVYGALQGQPKVLIGTGNSPYVHTAVPAGTFCYEVSAVVGGQEAAPSNEACKVIA